MDDSNWTVHNSFYLLDKSYDKDKLNEGWRHLRHPAVKQILHERLFYFLNNINMGDGFITTNDLCRHPESYVL